MTPGKGSPKSSPIDTQKLAKRKNVNYVLTVTNAQDTKNAVLNVVSQFVRGILFYNALISIKFKHNFEKSDATFLSFIFFFF